MTQPRCLRASARSRSCRSRPNCSRRFRSPTCQARTSSNPIRHCKSEQSEKPHQRTIRQPKPTTETTAKNKEDQFPSKLLKAAHLNRHEIVVTIKDCMVET